MSLIPTAIGGALGGFGKKPIIPDVEQIDVRKLQKGAIADNEAALPAAQNLAAKTNRFNTQQMRQMFEQVLGSNFGAAEQVIGDQLRGVVNQDVQRQIQDSSAARSLGLGGGAGLANALSLRSLGLTSMGQQQQGVSNTFGLGQLMRSPLMDASSMFFSPQQRLMFAAGERDARFNRQKLANQIDAMPDPFMAALTQAGIQEYQEFQRTARETSVAAIQAAGNAGSGA